MTTHSHVGGRNQTCPNCSEGMKPRRCMFFNKDKSLTRYAFSCGYVEEKRSKNLSMEHNTFHVKGWNEQGEHVWKSFDSLKDARRFLRAK
jgi:hypothetical protein